MPPPLASVRAVGCGSRGRGLSRGGDSAPAGRWADRRPPGEADRRTCGTRSYGRAAPTRPWYQIGSKVTTCPVWAAWMMVPAP